jgi:ABC-type glycerol-3-phosphate transport system substrate-binding protein
LRKIYFVSLIVTVLLLLAGCTVLTHSGKTLTPTPVLTAEPILATPTTTQPEIDVDISKLKGLQIFFMHPWTGAAATLMDNLVSEFNQTNTWGIQVNEVTPGSEGSLQDTLLADMQNSLPPEVIAAPIDELLALNRNSKTVVDLSPYVDSSQWGMDAATLQNFSPLFWNQDAVDGYRYAIPAQRTAKVMFYNKTWAAELGFTTPPVTLDDFTQQACAAHVSFKKDSDPTNDGLGGWLIDNDAMTIASWATALGAPLEADGKITFNTPEMQQTYGYLRTLIDSGCAWQGKETSPYNYFAKRQALMYSADLQDLSQQQLSSQLAGSTDDWMVIPYPTQGKPFILTEGPSYAILATTSEKKLAAWLFIRWMSSADHIGALVKASTTLPLSQNIINYSIELEDSIPQWKQAVDLLPDAQIVPGNAYWRQAEMILEDATWQFITLNMKGDQIPGLTQEMDQTLTDLIGKN